MYLSYALTFIGSGNCLFASLRWEIQTMRINLGRIFVIFIVLRGKGYDSLAVSFEKCRIEAFTTTDQSVKIEDRVDHRVVSSVRPISTALLFACICTLRKFSVPQCTCGLVGLWDTESGKSIPVFKLFFWNNFTAFPERNSSFKVIFWEEGNARSVPKPAIRSKFAQP